MGLDHGPGSQPIILECADMSDPHEQMDPKIPIRLTSVALLAKGKDHLDFTGWIPGDTAHGEAEVSQLVQGQFSPSTQRGKLFLGRTALKFDEENIDDDIDFVMSNIRDAKK